MSQNKGQIDSGGNNVQKQGPGDMVMDQKKSYPITTVGSGVIPAEAMLSGLIDRSGPTGAYADVLPTAAALLAACPMLGVGDAFEFLLVNGVAFANTVAAPADGSGVLGANTATAASAVRRYMVTVMGVGSSRVHAMNTVNGSPTLAGLTQNQARNITPGMGVSGTGIPANTVVASVNSTTGSVTLSNNATADGTLIPITFNPRYIIRGLYSASA